jgi:hypothetical protein
MSRLVAGDAVDLGWGVRSFATAPAKHHDFGQLAGISSGAVQPGKELGLLPGTRDHRRQFSDAQDVTASPESTISAPFLQNH